MSEDNTTDCLQGAKNALKIEAITEDLKEFKDTIRSFEADIWKTVNEIRNDLVRRPTWAVTMWITGCTSTTIALIVFIATHIFTKGVGP